MTPPDRERGESSNAFVWLRGRVAPAAQALIGVLPEDQFQPVSLVTPPAGVRFVIGGVAQPYGAAIDLADIFAVHSPGEVIAFHVINESDEAQHVAVLINGIAVNIRGDVTGPELAGELTGTRVRRAELVRCDLCGSDAVFTEVRDGLPYAYCAGHFPRSAG